MSLSNQKYHLCRRFLIGKAAFCLVGTRAQLIQCGIPVYMRARGEAHDHLTQRFSERARMTSQCISFTCWFVCYESCGKFASLEKLLVFCLRSDCKPVKSTLTSTENVYGLLLVENPNCVKGKKRKLWMLQCDTGVSRKTVSTELVTWQSQTTTRYSVKCSIRSDKVFVLSSVIQ